MVSSMSPVRPLMQLSCLFASEASLRKILGGSESWKLDVNPYSILVKRILAIMLLRHGSQRKKSEIPHVIADSGKSLYLFNPWASNLYASHTNVNRYLNSNKPPLYNTTDAFAIYITTGLVSYESSRMRTRDLHPQTWSLRLGSVYIEAHRGFGLRAYADEVSYIA